jgi:hypothetical protein
LNETCVDIVSFAAMSLSDFKEPEEAGDDDREDAETRKFESVFAASVRDATRCELD